MTAKMRLKRVLVGGQYALLIAGISVLGYCAVVVSEASLYQADAREQLMRGNIHRAALSSTTGTVASSTGKALRVAGLPVLGRVEVPRIQLSAMIADGDSPQALRVAIGHVPGTALPWQPGNVALAAHRDTFFRRLGELRPGDVIRLTVPGKEYTYHVTFTDIVKPDETWVLQPASGDTLTLVTCYPFHYIGAAPKRFVVRARRMGLAPVTRGSATSVD